MFLTSSEAVFFALRLPIFRRISTSSANCIKRRKARLQNQSVLWSGLPDGREFCAVLPESRTVDTTIASLWTWAAFVEGISVALENCWNPKNTFWGMLDKSEVLLNSQYSRYSLLSLCNEVCWAPWGRWEMRIQRAHHPWRHLSGPRKWMEGKTGVKPGAQREMGRCWVGKQGYIALSWMHPFIHSFNNFEST